MNMNIQVTISDRIISATIVPEATFSFDWGSSFPLKRKRSQSERHDQFRCVPPSY